MLDRLGELPTRRGVGLAACGANLAGEILCTLRGAIVHSLEILGGRVAIRKQEFPRAEVKVSSC